jgi:quercetin dioxygenase-like cupin family protein
MQYRIDFKDLDWETPLEGVRHKYLDQDNIRMRLVEYGREMPPHWCDKAHYGIVLEGIFDIEFDGQTLRYEKGDGLFLPAGKDHRHKARSITEKVLIFFVEIVRD